MIAPARERAGVSACFPAFDDAEGIGWVVRRARKTLVREKRPFEILVLNDGSRDRTGAVLSDLKAEIPELRVLEHAENRGYGATLRDLFSAARMELVFYTDGDGQFDPADLAPLLAAFEGADPPVGWGNGYRHARADGLLRQRLGPRFQRVVAATFGLPALRDWDCDFRLFRRDLAPERHMTFPDGTAVVQFLAAFARRGVPFAEVPVRHAERRSAARSRYFRPRSVVAGHQNLLRLRRRLGRPPIRWQAWRAPPQPPG